MAKIQCNNFFHPPITFFRFHVKEIRRQQSFLCLLNVGYGNRNSQKIRWDALHPFTIKSIYIYRVVRVHVFLSVCKTQTTIRLTIHQVKILVCWQTKLFPFLFHDIQPHLIPYIKSRPRPYLGFLHLENIHLKTNFLLFRFFRDHTTTPAKSYQAHKIQQPAFFHHSNFYN